MMHRTLLCRYFYATLHLGTPARQFAVIVDTGSTITYVPCASCGRNCGPHHKACAMFPPPQKLSRSQSKYLETLTLSLLQIFLPGILLPHPPQFACFLTFLQCNWHVWSLRNLQMPGSINVVALDQLRFFLPQDAAFDPASSSSSAIIGCDSDKCICGRPPCGCSEKRECTYQRTYGAHSV